MRKLLALFLSFILMFGSISFAAAATKGETFAIAQNDVISDYLFHSVDMSLLFREVKTQQDLEYNFIASEYLYSVSSFCALMMGQYENGAMDKEKVDSLLQEQASFLTETLSYYMDLYNTDRSLLHEGYLRLLTLRYETPMDKYTKLDAELKEKTGHTFYELVYEIEAVEGLRIIHKAYGNLSAAEGIAAVIKEMEITYGADWTQRLDIQ